MVACHQHLPAESNECLALTRDISVMSCYIQWIAALDNSPDHPVTEALVMRWNNMRRAAAEASRVERPFVAMLSGLTPLPW